MHGQTYIKFGYVSVQAGEITDDFKEKLSLEILLNTAVKFLF